MKKIGKSVLNPSWKQQVTAINKDRKYAKMAALKLSGIDPDPTHWRHKDSIKMRLYDEWSTKNWRAEITILRHRSGVIMPDGIIRLNIDTLKNSITKNLDENNIKYTIKEYIPGFHGKFKYVVWVPKHTGRGILELLL